MKVQDLFIIFLKLLGIYVVVINVQSILGYIPILALDSDSSAIFYTLGGLLAIIGIVFILFKYGDAILKFVLPEKGLESTTIDLGTINKESLLEIGIVLISFSLIIRYVQVLILQIFYFFKSKVEYRGVGEVFDSFSGGFYNTDSLYQAIINIIFGLVLIALRKSIVKLF